MRRHIFPWVFNFKKNISVRLNITGKINIEKIANGSSYEGNFVDGRYNGKGIYFNPEKNETYEGTFKDGKINGFAVQRRADGSVYEGFFENNSRIGRGRNISEDGSVTEGHWEDDKFIVDNTESAIQAQHRNRKLCLHQSQNTRCSSREDGRRSMGRMPKAAPIRQVKTMPIF